MARAYIGLGANLGDPPAQLRAALARIAALEGTTLTAQSGFFRSAPLGPPDGKKPQAHYCNAVCEVETALGAEQLLEQLHAIEIALGRQRPPERWAPRLIDLDLLIYDALQRSGKGLQLPHPELHKRNFVLAPLAEIAPDLVVPGQGRVADLAAAAGRAGLARWPQEKPEQN